MNFKAKNSLNAVHIMGIVAKATAGVEEMEVFASSILQG
jgi:hypothetical protein